jgi:hypothetical protein
MASNRVVSATPEITMRTRSRRSIVSVFAISATAIAISSAIVGAQDSSAVTDVLALQNRINDAALNGDGAVFEEVLSRDFVTNPPSNRVARRAELIALFSSGQVAYTSIEATVDFAEQLGEGLVVVMGTESTRQSAVPRDSGLGADVTETVLHRRYTNVFRREDGGWRLLVKQSTAIPSI